MSSNEDLDKFDEEEIDADPITRFQATPIDKIEKDKLDVLLAHRRHVLRLRAIRKILLALLTQLPTLLIIIKQFNQ